MKRAPAEPMLPLDCRQRRGGWKRRPSETREDPTLDGALLHLFRCGRTVYQQGGQHRIDGRIVERLQLLALAASLGWRP